MGEAVYTMVDFEVNPTISDRFKKIIFINEILRNVREIDANIFRTIYRGIEIEVINIKGDILGVFTG